MIFRSPRCFSGVRIKEAVNPPTHQNLLTAGTISLRFSLWDLLQKKYRVKNIRLDNIELGLRIYADGSDNFHFWKQSSSSGNQNLISNCNALSFTICMYVL
ncbi:MAG: hypothetical protein U0Z17_03115 [Bacteroidales bacterium]